MGRVTCLLCIAGAVGCAGEGKLCVSHADCGSGLVCTESFQCARPAPEGLEQCVDAHQGVVGIHPVSVSAGRFRGDVGPFRGFNNTACDQAAFSDNGNLTVNTVIPSERGPAMTIVDVRNGLGRADFVPGRTVTFTGDAEAVVHGCAQWETSNWGFDIPSDSVTFTVRQGNGSTWIYDYTAHFPGGVDPVYGAYNEHQIAGTFSLQK